MTSMSAPDAAGHFGRFGGRFVPETLVPACQELEVAFAEAWADPAFRAALRSAIDRAALVSQVWGKYATVSKQMYPTGMVADGLAADDWMVEYFCELDQMKDDRDSAIRHLLMGYCKLQKLERQGKGYDLDRGLFEEAHRHFMLTLDQARAYLPSVGENLRTAVKLKEQHAKAAGVTSGKHRHARNVGERRATATLLPPGRDGHRQNVSHGRAVHPRIGSRNRGVRSRRHDLGPGARSDDFRETHLARIDAGGGEVCGRQSDDDGVRGR